MADPPAKKTRTQRSAELAERRADMWRMAINGQSQEEIGRHYGITQQAVSEQLRKANQDRPARAVDEWRALTLDKLDRLERVVLAVMARKHPLVSGGRIVTTGPEGDETPLIDDGPVLAAVARIIDISKHRLDVVPGLKAATRLSVEAEQLAKEIAELVEACGIGGDDDCTSTGP